MEVVAITMCIEFEGKQGTRITEWKSAHVPRIEDCVDWHNHSYRVVDVIWLADQTKPSVTLVVVKER